MKIIKVIGGGLTWNPASPEYERTHVLLALENINFEIETTGEHKELSLHLHDEKNDKKYNLNITVDRLSELEDVINRGTVPLEARAILETLKPKDRMPEKPRKPGMSWVHMGVREGTNLVCWVTACVVKHGEHSIRASFAFCRAGDCFSKRVGRIMSRKRLDVNQYVELMCSNDRYSSVKSYILNKVAGKTPTNLITDTMIRGSFPIWMDPDRERRGDVPADVVELMEELRENRKLDPGTRHRVARILDKDRTPEYDTWPIRE